MQALANKIDDHTIQFVRILPGPIEKIWDYLVDSEKRGQWFAKGAFPAKVGEPFELRWKHSELSPNSAPPPESMAEMDKTGHKATNILLKIEPPHLLAFTFGGSKMHPDKISEVEFKLTQEGPPADNKVRFTLTHSKIPDESYRTGVTGGWQSHLEMLQYRAEGKTPPAFWDVWRDVQAAYGK
jgi:uncharacterized protein YndB with AHSA1/START domain